MNGVISTENYDILKHVVNGNIEDYSIIVHDSNKKGEGFSGELCYVSLKDNNSENSVDVIIKQAYTEKKVREIHPTRKLFLGEIHFYDKIWPCFQKFQKDRSLSNPFDKIPKCFITSSEDKREKLVIENLKYKSFETYDKKRPLDDEHFKFIFKEYGKFHAISFAYKRINPQEYEEITNDLENLFTEFGKQEFFSNYTKYIYGISLECLDPQTDANVIEKFKHHVEKATEIFCTKSVYHGDYSVLLHGDCWSNNMMFKYNKSKQLCDIRLIDFQCAKVGTPVHDLSYCLYSGASKNVLDQLDCYLRIYYNSLLEALAEFGLDSEDIYPFEALKKDWKEYCQIGFTMGVMLWRMKLTHEKDIKDLTDIKDIDDGKVLENAGYDVKTFNSTIRDLIVHMYENDFL